MLRFVLLGLTFFTTLALALGVGTSKVPVETQAAAFAQRVLRGSTDLDFRQLQQRRVCAEEDFVGCNTDDLLDDHLFTGEMTDSCGTFYQESLVSFDMLLSCVYPSMYHPSHMGRSAFWYS